MVGKSISVVTIFGRTLKSRHDEIEESPDDTEGTIATSLRSAPTRDANSSLQRSSMGMT